MKNLTTEKGEIAFGRVENIVGKGENAGYLHFLHFPQCFLKASFSGSLKVGLVWERVNRHHKSLLYIRMKCSDSID